MSVQATRPVRCEAVSMPQTQPHAEDRLQALGRYQILDSEREPSFDSIVALAAGVCQVRYAAVSFLDGQRQWFKAVHGLDVSETPSEEAFCKRALAGNSVFEVCDASRDCRFAANSFVTGPPYVRFYAAMPILASDGTAIGTLCVFDPKPRRRGLDALQHQTLQVLAGQIQSLLELRNIALERQAQLAAKSELAKRLRHVAEHDALTGLPHRRPFQKRLAEAMRDAETSNQRVALMLIDVDHFKQINDALGHDFGDAMLRKFANRLRASVRSSDTVARLGGDEFGVLLKGIDRDEEIAAIARSLNERLHAPMQHRGRSVECRASIGMAIFPDHAATSNGLIKCSDLALAEAKRERGRVAMFSESMTEEFERETRMLSLARGGIERERFVVHYQPKIDLRTGAIAGFEALLRYDAADGAPLLPEEFARALVDRELGPQITQRMISTVLDDVRRWADAGLDCGHVAINTGAVDFHGDDFGETLLAEIEKRNLRPSMIEVEVTEGVFLGRGAHHVERALSLLSGHGVRIALDDFGTGYASLTHLRSFRVDILKIDRSFVKGLGVNIDDTAIVRALIGLGQSLGIETVAEGIETQAQLDLVRAMGCDIGQGYLYSPALPSHDIPTVIALHQAEAPRIESGIRGVASLSKGI